MAKVAAAQKVSRHFVAGMTVVYAVGFATPMAFQVLDEFNDG